MVFNPFDQLKIRTARMVVAAWWVLALVPIAVFTAYHSKASFHSEKGRCLTGGLFMACCQYEYALSAAGNSLYQTVKRLFNLTDYFSRT